jgi:regulatory protein
MTAVTVTALSKQRRSKRIDVHIDGTPRLSITPDIALQFGLRTGATLSESRIEELRAAQLREDAMAAALRLVSYRPRSEKELRDRLSQRFPDPALVDTVVDRLVELRLIDDAAFAASWVESRDRSGPRSRRMLAAELRLKGVSRTPADAAVETVDEEDAAYRAAKKKAQVMTGRPFEEFRRKIGDLLLRRGFRYDTANETVKRLWEETRTAADAASGEQA